MKFDTTFRSGLIHISLKAIIIEKSSLELINNQSKVSLENFYNWSTNIKPPSHTYKNIKPDGVEEIISEVFEFILNTTSQKDKEIKVGHIFFGIMKALRIKVGDLHFINSN